jgi:hypothetical protein
MIRKNTKQEAFGSLYRHIIPPSLKEAWRMKWLWLPAFFASMLQTGGVYDVVLVAFKQAKNQGTALLDPNTPPYIISLYERIILAPSVFSASGAIISLLIGLVISLGLIGFSLISQGALVFGHGGRIRGRMPTLRETLTIGARYLPRILFLNIITLFLLWLARFIMIVPVAYTQTNPSVWLSIATVIAGLLYIAAAIAVTSVHLFALNAIVLQDAHVAESIIRAWHLFKKSWVHVLEIGLVLFVISALLLVTGFVAFLMMVLPVFLLMIVGASLNASAVVYVAYVIGVILFFSIMITVGVVSVSFQYSAWHHLFIRLGEGGTAPKIHRWLRWLTGSYNPS